MQQGDSFFFKSKIASVKINFLPALGLNLQDLSELTGSSYIKRKKKKRIC